MKPKVTVLVLIALMNLSLLPQSFAGRERQSLPPSEVLTTLSFAELVESYHSGVTGTFEHRKGDWLLVASNQSSACDLMTPITNWDGILNRDDTTVTLSFSELERRVPGGKVQKIEVMTAKNLGNKEIEQGPFEYRSEEPQFSLFMYTEEGGSQSSDYVRHSCRLIGENLDQQICLGKVVLSPPVSFKYEKGCSYQPVGLAWLFKKLK